MSTHAFHLTPRMVDKEAFRLLGQYAMWAVSLEHAMDEIQYVLGSNFDEDKWMDVTQCILMNPLCFADVEKVFMERLAEKESSNATSLAHLLDEPTQQWKDCESEVGTSSKRVEVATEGDDREGMLSTSVRHSSGKAPQNSKCRKMGISQFLDLAAEEDNSEDDYADKDIDETQGSAGCPMDAGPARKSSFSCAIDGLMARYSGSSRPHNMQKQKLPQILEGIPLPMMKNIYIVDLVLASAQSFMYEYMKSNGVDIKGPYKGDIGFVKRSYPTNVILIVAPRECPYDLPEQHGEKSLFSILAQIRCSRNLEQRAQWQLSLFLPTDERSEGDVNAMGNTIHCAIQELHRVFNTGQAVRIILEVSDLLLEAHMPDHVCSLATGHTDTRICLPEPADVVLPGDTVNVSQGAYKGTEAPIEWMSVNGFDICVGDDVEVARGKWFRSRGTVQMVHFDNAYLDFVCDTYGQKISVPITFCHKVAEHSGLLLSQWIGQDVWVIHGEKKGYQGTLRTLRRDISCVALQGQLIQLRNDYIATPTGLVLNGTRLPLSAVQELQC
ncbi:hypothetical protein EDC04DRAFT_2611371 [Pisolithus marmoratus]|nr:hypothetical protein EDC04DRAFT_2611371 [Pisolithus marmoratus]